MTFRLPTEILRAVSRPTSPNRILNPNIIQRDCLSKITFSSFVDANNNNRRLLQNTSASLLRQQLPQYPFFRRFVKTFIENRKNVHKQSKCDEKKCGKKLEFRQTNREDCKQYTVPVPDKCPKLPRLKSAYDDSKSKWKHEDCIDFCATIERADNVRGYNVVKKKLPKLEPSKDFEPCAPFLPTKAPKLCRPEKLFNYKTDPERICSKNLCNIDPPRMDDIVGVTVVPKKLPKLPEIDYCPNCEPHVPKYAPKLTRPKRNFNYKMDPKRICPQMPCNIDPPRMDDVRGYKVSPKKLPNLEPSKDCSPCIEFQESKRADDLFNVKKSPKKLPMLEPLKSECPACEKYMPTYVPKLKRLKPVYDDLHMPWRHHSIPNEIPKSERMDDIHGYRTERKKLPVYLKSSNDN